MIWKDRIKQYPHRYTLTNVSGSTYDFTEVTGEVIEAGTPVSAENMNKLLQRDGDDIKDTVTTFTEAGTRANIATGENTSTIFGKIKKWFADLKPHAFNDLATALGAETDKAPTNKLLNDTAALKIDKTDISTVAPLSSAAASNEKVYSEKLAFDQLALKAGLADDNIFTGANKFDRTINGVTNELSLNESAYDIFVCRDTTNPTKKTAIAKGYVWCQESDNVYGRFFSQNIYYGDDVNGYEGTLKFPAANIGEKYLAVTDNADGTLDSLYDVVIKQPDKTYVLYHATAGANNLYLSAATYTHTYAVAGAYLIIISGTGSSATVDWGDGTSETVNLTDGFKVNNQTDKDKYIDVYLGTNCTTIGSYAFSRCSKLTSVIIPNSVTSIGVGAFDYCSGLTSVIIPDSVTSIGSSAFYGCSGLTSITIPDSVTSIGNSAFYGCSGLTSITIPDSVTSIGNSAFGQCTALTSVIIGSGMTSIVQTMFSGCSGLTSITIPNSVTEIGYQAFYNCTGLTSITIPDSVGIIGAGAFMGCIRLTSVTIGSSITDIGDSAFKYCYRLAAINFLCSTIPTIYPDGFNGCRIADIIAQTSALADSAATAITNAGGTLLTNYRKLY